MAEAKQELIVSKQVLSLPQKFSTGPIMGRFLIELRDNQRIMALKTRANGRYLLPPREVDAWSHESEGDWVEVGPGGYVREFDIIYYASPDPLSGETREVPYCIAWVMLDGVTSDSPLWHLIKPEDTGKVKGGVRVRAVFAEERVGAMEDIKYFEVVD